MSRRDPVHWINNWVWTFDPREVASTSLLPFDLFPKQVEFINWLKGLEEAQDEGVAEKSRDMGLTWLCSAYAAHRWLFQPGFAIGFGSRKLELVDKIGDPDCIFEKIRFVLDHLPKWMLPIGFKKSSHDHRCKITNPMNGSTITGEGGDQIGRGGRKTLYFIDEHAFLEHTKKVEAALSQTARCKVRISTPNGVGNEFYRIRHSGAVKVFTFHWRDDPRKDDAWYKRQQEILDPVILAQEVDIDYNASVEGITIPGKWVQAAVNLELKYANGKPYLPHGPRVAGFDVADGGPCKNVLIIRQGPVVQLVDGWHGEARAAAWKALDGAESSGAAILQYDANGPGTEVGDTYANSEREPQCSIRPVNMGDLPSDRVWPDGKTSGDKYLNLKAETWWLLRERFRKAYEYKVNGVYFDPEDMISIPQHQELIIQLSIPRSEYSENGKIRIESKLKLQIRGVASPDYAEALTLTEVPMPPMVADNWSPSMHITCRESFPDEWRRFRVVFYRYPGRCTCGWVAVDPSNRLFFYRELVMENPSALEFAQTVKSMTPANERPYITVCNPGIFKTDRMTQKSVGLILTQNKLPCIEGHPDVMQGWSVVKDYLRVRQFHEADGRTSNSALINFSSSCPMTIRELSTLDVAVGRDPDVPGFECAQLVRLAVMSRPSSEAKEIDPKTRAEVEDLRFLKKEFPEVYEEERRRLRR